MGKKLDFLQIITSVGIKKLGFLKNEFSISINRGRIPIAYGYPNY